MIQKVLLSPRSNLIYRERSINQRTGTSVKDNTSRKTPRSFEILVINMRIVAGIVTLIGNATAGCRQILMAVSRNIDSVHALM